MKKNGIFLVSALGLMVSCNQPERNCSDFKNGNFSFSTSIDGQELKTTFTRTDDLEIDFYNGKIDSSSIRWINDCEYIAKKMNPKNRAEGKPVHMKILSTTENSYTFEYSIVGEVKKQRGIVLKQQ